MKNFAKFIPVALGLLTLASCSSDDLFSEKTVAEEAQPGDLYVTMEDLQEEGSVFTRSFIDGNTNIETRKYVPMDMLRVYDNDLHKYDIYAFTWTDKAQDKGVFRRWNTDTNISTPKWAIYPKDNVKKGSWTYNEETNFTYTEATMIIEPNMTYDATYSLTDTEFKTPLYKDVLPRWGAVTSVNDGDKLQCKLNYMTGVLRLKLAGIPDYAKYVLVKMYVGGVETNQVVMTGEFTTTIAKADNPDPNAMLTYKETLNGWSKKTGIRVELKEPADLVGNAKKHAVVYVPLVTTVDPVTGKSTTVDIVTYIPTSTASLARIDQPGDWKVLQRFKNKKIEKAKLYGNKSEVNLAVDGNDIDALNDALELSTPDTEETVVLTATSPNGIEVCSTGSNPSNVLEIPNTPGVKNFIIDLSNGLYCCNLTGANGILTIVDKDPGNPFTGNVMLIGKAKSGEPMVTLDVQLPSAKFGFAGDALSTLTSPFKTSNIDAKGFTLGDGKTTTNSYGPGRFVMSDNVATINVSEKAVFDGTLTVSPTKYQGVTEINVNNGWITGAIDASAAANPVNITIKNVNEDGDDAKVEGNITTKGEVTIASNFGGFQTVTADGAISVSKKAVVQKVDSKESTVTLTDEVHTVSVHAKGNIAIDKQALNLGGAGIVSDEGNISISNEFKAATTQTGVITATKGSVTLNEGGKFTATYNGAITAGTDVKLSGKVYAQEDITAGNDFEMTGESYANGNVNLAHTATVNITTNGGDAKAVNKMITFAGGDAYTLNLLSGAVYQVDATAGEVALTFSDQPAFAAICEVVTPDNLKPTNPSIWNGKPLTIPDAYWVEGAGTDKTRIWTASQLGMMQGVTTSTLQRDIRSNINLNDEEWAGIDGQYGYTLNGNGKIISNLKIMGNRPNKTGGFFNGLGTAGSGTLNVNNLTFDGVKTEIAVISVTDTYGGGIGAIVGRAECDDVVMTRVNVKLAAGNFGSDGVDNLTTRNVGGLIGYAESNVTLTGVTVDASEAVLTGWRSLGGFIGFNKGNLTIKMAEKTSTQPMVKPGVTGVKFNVTYDDSENVPEINDPWQGATGWLVGYFYLNGFNADIADIADVKPAIVQVPESKANEGHAFKIVGATSCYYFKRGGDKDDPLAEAHQSLIGNSGYDVQPAANHININNAKYMIDKEGEGWISGSKKLYTLKKTSYNP